MLPTAGESKSIVFAEGTKNVHKALQIGSQFGLSVVLLCQAASAQIGATDPAATGGASTFGSGLGTNSFEISGFGSGAQSNSIQSAFSGAALGGNALGGNTGLTNFGRGFVGGGIAGGGFGGGGFGGGGAGQNQENQTPIPFTLKLGFKPKLRSPAEVARTLTSRMVRLPLPVKFANMSVAVQGTTAIITGQVPTHEDAEVAKQLVLLEPGIEDVQNDLSWQRENDWDQPEVVFPR